MKEVTACNVLDEMVTVLLGNTEDFNLSGSSCFCKLCRKFASYSTTYLKMLSMINESKPIVYCKGKGAFIMSLKSTITISSHHFRLGITV